MRRDDEEDWASVTDRATQKAECGFVKHEPTIRRARIRPVYREGSFRLAAERPRCQRGSVIVRLSHDTR
jgi:hypothetical protein